MTSLPGSVPSSAGPYIGTTAVPRASTAPPPAWPDSMRPIPASKFQLTPQPGAATAIFCSALRYAASAMDGMPSAPGEFTINGGGGAVEAASATWKAVGACSMAMTTGPERSGTVGETAATGVTAARTGGTCARAGGACPWNGGAEPPTAPAKTKGAITAT